MQAANILNPPLPQKPSEQLRFGNLRGTSSALVISQIAKNYSTPILAITQDTLSADRLEQALNFFAPELTVLNFPDWETLPYDRFSPHQDITSQRLYTLAHLPELKRGILVVPATTLMQRVAPREYLQATTFIINRGDKINLTEMRLRLERCGYRCVGQVMEHGEFAVRGSILDLFPTGSEFPYRIDLFDEEVDTIRTFDTETQRSSATIEKINLLPAREFPLTEAAITHFRQSWREQFAGNPALAPMYQEVSQGICPPGVEYYFPLFFSTTQNLLNYLPENSLILMLENIHQSAEQFWTEINERYEQNRHDTTRPLLAPAQLYLPVNELFGQLNQFPQINLQQNEIIDKTYGINFATQPPPELLVDNKAENPLAMLQNFINNNITLRILFGTESLGRREALFDLLKPLQLELKTYHTWQEFIDDNAPIGIVIAPLEQGLSIQDPAIILITENQLFGQRVMQQRRRRRSRQFDSESIIRNLAELNIGAPVVHIEHGVGRYLGLQTLTLNDVPVEFLTLEYAGGDKLYVPVSALHLISRYSGVDLEHAPLHRLGTPEWEKAKRKAAEKIKDVAVELLDVYARRAAHQGYAFMSPDAQYSAFAATFPFEETPDQQQAIEQVISDMQSPRCMDRVVCGDVGFGKTEVAMRAAFIAVQDGKQVCILVPTTLLAQQHYQNFKDRFAEWPVNIETISRFRSAKEQKEILEKTNAGKVDILIGTHRLLQKDVSFKNLGLLIIDEEHRFGVQQKEKIKTFRTEVDVLTLTATPIPRTLNMALSKVRDLSIIATPPAKRLSIKTFVRERSTALIKEAITRELLRGGQVFFLHNEVASIENCADEIATLVPEARAVVAHGQMPERELERVMKDFYHRRYNILICSTIIENGIDIPTANTIIIERADKFGLAQLHQLRGRVGRSHHQAYAYMITPPRKAMTADAVKRLDAIESLEDLGAGFTLATHDLEIRGAGELLGEEQSGDMQAIGFALYTELLEQAVEALKSGKQPILDKPLKRGAEIDLQIAALIPEDYIPDVHARLILYKRIANAANKEAIQELQVEMIDRFGALPEASKNLFAVMELKFKAESLGIRKIDAGKHGGRIEFTDNPNIEPAQLIKLIQKFPQQYKFDGPKALKFIQPLPESKQRIADVGRVLETLSSAR